MQITLMEKSDQGKGESTLLEEAKRLAAGGVTLTSEQQGGNLM